MSNMMPKNVRQLVGPSTFSSSNGTTSRVHTCSIIRGFLGIGTTVEVPTIRSRSDNEEGEILPAAPQSMIGGPLKC